MGIVWYVIMCGMVWLVKTLKCGIIWLRSDTWYGTVWYSSLFDYVFNLFINSNVAKCFVTRVFSRFQTLSVKLSLKIEEC
jgi:hypothetical protein